MIVRDTLVAALASLRANKLRSALTLLGIVIGVVAVVSMTATIAGLRRRIEEDISSLGSGVFQVQKEPVFGDHHRPEIQRRKNLTLADVHLLQDKCNACLRVAGELWSWGQSVTANGVTKPGVMVAGGTYAFFDNNGFSLASGRLLTEGETAGGGDAVVIGSDVVDLLFPDVDPIGQTLRVRGHPFRVVGVLERRGSGMGGFSRDNLIVVPLPTFMPLFGARRSMNITVQAISADHMQRAQDQVVALLRRARGVPPEAENDFEVFSNDSVRDTFNSLAGSIAAASIGISAISLLIGGIGVMNIMLVSVTERTSEIGLRRALGARRRWILGQFLAEAVALTLVGGVLGVLLGASFAALVRVLVDVPTVIPASSVVASILTAAAVGLVFGVYPALRASRLDPVEAMRHE